MQKLQNNKPNNNKNFFIWLLIFIGIMIFTNLISNPSNLTGNNLIFSDFIKKVEDHEVLKVEIKGDDLIGSLKDGSQIYTYLPNYPNLVKSLKKMKLELLPCPWLVVAKKLFPQFLIGFH